MTLHALRPSSLDDISAMRCHLFSERVVAASAPRTFDILATGEGQSEWAGGYRATTWYGSAPHDVGTIRDIHLRWITVRERFLAWQPAVRFTFSADAMSIPLARRMIEDITVDPVGPDRCRLVWQVHLDPALVLRPIESLVMRRFFEPMFDSFAAGLARYAGAHPDQPSDLPRA
ncbi:SRPBCC family protein [Nocardia sp. NBC_00508]|uniref:SRPBCC family protein n=1 Tax=Nocardia sp. NBC_00508 TaxID=2975992 RepID=UPI002E81A10E|nr:SRPBCC family protein [Nocardia sp. NBC_00508]WUD63747.1 SRPBCC family protein [Nocardia sp. NBC_00508]